MIDFTIAPFADALLRGALTHPDRDCIVVDNDRVTYSELEARARLVGRSLIALGIQRGDRVGILMANGLDYTDMLSVSYTHLTLPTIYSV